MQQRLSWLSAVWQLSRFLGITLLGKYADMQHKTVEAARYVAWEKVIWADSRQKMKLILRWKPPIALWGTGGRLLWIKD